MMTLALALIAADAPAPAPPLLPVARVIIPAGTPIHFSTAVALDSRTAKQGQRFELRVSEDVRVGAVTIIAKGTPAVGEVEAVSGKGMVGKPGQLSLQPLFIQIAGERAYLTGSAVERGADATTGVAVGSILVSSLGMFITGKSASLPAGTRIDGRFRSDVSVPAPAAAAN